MEVRDATDFIGILRVQSPIGTAPAWQGGWGEGIFRFISTPIWDCTRIQPVWMLVLD